MGFCGNVDRGIFCAGKKTSGSFIINPSAFLDPFGFSRIYSPVIKHSLDLRIWVLLTYTQNHTKTKLRKG